MDVVSSVRSTNDPSKNSATPGSGLEMTRFATAGSGLRRQSTRVRSCVVSGAVGQSLFRAWPPSPRAQRKTCPGVAKRVISRPDPRCCRHAAGGDVGGDGGGIAVVGGAVAAAARGVEDHALVG